LLWFGLGGAIGAGVWIRVRFRVMVRFVVRAGVGLELGLSLWLGQAGLLGRGYWGGVIGLRLGPGFARIMVRVRIGLRVRARVRDRCPLYIETFMKVASDPCFKTE
jgi:hypothetical protein